MSATCDNPRCSCSPCTCGAHCRCGQVTLGDLERQVMEILWERPGVEMTARTVADRLPVYAYTTVATVLNRLTQKGVVRRRMVDRVTRFVALDTQAALAAQAMRDALGAAENPRDALAHFVETATPAELSALRDAMEDRAGGTTRAPRRARRTAAVRS